MNKKPSPINYLKLATPESRVRELLNEDQKEFSEDSRRGGKSRMGEDLDKEGDSVMIMAMPPSKGVRSTKRKRELEEARLSLMAVLGKNLKEMAPMVLARFG